MSDTSCTKRASAEVNTCGTTATAVVMNTLSKPSWSGVEYGIAFCLTACIYTKCNMRVKASILRYFQRMIHTSTQHNSSMRRYIQRTRCTMYINTYLVPSTIRLLLYLVYQDSKPPHTRCSLSARYEYRYKAPGILYLLLSTTRSSAKKVG